LKKERVTLQDLLVANLDPMFVENLLSDIRFCYKESVSHWVESPILGEPEIRSLTPYLRRCLVEKHFRDRAVEVGHTATVEKTETDSAEYSVVRANGIELTISKTDGPAALPVASRFREQRSDANGLLQQGQLFPVSVDAEDRSRITYAIITHGPRVGNPSEVGHICIGFPNPTLDGWAEPPVALVEILERMVLNRETNAVVEPERKTVQPKLKPGVVGKAPNRSRTEGKR